MKILKLQFVFLLIGITTFGQNITLTPQNEVCFGDGQVSLEINNLDEADANLDIQIFRGGSLQDEQLGQTATGTSFSTVFTNLPADSYAITIGVTYPSTATETLNDTFIIGSDYTAMTVSIAQADACGGKEVVVSVSGGNGPFNYQLLDTSNNLILDNGTNNTFLISTNGDYRIRVTDACGEIIVQGFSTSFTPVTYTSIRPTLGKVNPGCSTIQIISNILGNSNIPSYLFPIDFTYQVTSPSLGTVTINDTWVDITDRFKEFTVDLHLNETYTVETTLTDVCGDTASETVNLNTTPQVQIGPKNAIGCGRYIRGIFPRAFSVNGDWAVEVISAPAAFVPADFGFDALNQKTVTPEQMPDDDTLLIGDELNPVPEGTYEIRLTDECGAISTRTVTVDPVTVGFFEPQYPGCEDNEASYRIRINGTGVTFVGTSFITTAPADFVTEFGALPYDMSEFFDTDTSQFFIGDLPVGDYEFDLGTTCGNIVRSKTLVTKSLTSAVDFSLNCGSFNVSTTATTNMGTYNVYLQKFYEASGQWGHPETGTLWTPGLEIRNVYGARIFGFGNQGGTLLTRSGTLSNVASTGTMRVVFESFEYVNDGIAGTPFEEAFCITELDSFTVPANGIQFLDYFVVGCSPGAQKAIVLDVVANDPTFRITEKDGAPFVVDNGSDPVFENLDAGLYSIEVSDGCGNTSLFNVNVSTTDKLPVIRPSTLCEGDDGFLFLNGLSLFDISWTKDDPAGTVIGTGNRLNFTPYTKPGDLGTYYATIDYTPSPIGCDPLIISFELTTDNESNPNAGTGQSVSLTQSDINPSVNLFDYITGPFDAFGTWTETTTAGESGFLVGNEWFGSLASPGEYTFEYSVNGTCTNTDITTVTIELLGAFCTKPGDFSLPGSESKVGISTYLSTQEGWPSFVTNGFIALESNTKGFVISRVQNAGLITDAREGMLIYDIDANCVKLHNGTDWNCIQRGCNE